MIYVSRASTSTITSQYLEKTRACARLVSLPSEQDLEAFYKAKEAYTSEEVFGSDDKDVLQSDCFKVVGAEIDSRQFLVEGGLASCGLPAEKRLSLAMVHLCLLRFRWLQTLCIPAYSRLDYLNAALQEACDECPTGGLPCDPLFWAQHAGSQIVEAESICGLRTCCGCRFGPCFGFELGCPLPKIFATLRCFIAEGWGHWSRHLMLWRDADKRGANVPIHSRARAILKCCDPWFEEDGDAVFESREDDGEDDGPGAAAGEEVPRPIGLSFDFSEVCGGSGVVTTRLAGWE